MKRLTSIFAAMLLCVFMTSAAMAFNVTNRSAEMDDFSLCDRAGTIEMRLTQSDYDLIAAHLLAFEYARIRIALNGLSLPPSPTLPTLCRNIWGSVDGTGLGALGGNIPSTTLVALQTIGVEVSDVDGGATADLTAYVVGTAGNQYLEVYITGLDAAVAVIDPNNPPWFKIGLHDELIAAGDAETTPICAQVQSFSGVSTLTISNEAIPNTLTFSGDNEIGHFLTQTVQINECTKTEILDDSCPNTETIELCPLGGTPQAPACPTYYKCFAIEGDLPESGDIDINIRTNGAATGDNTQEGVYLKNVVVVTEAGAVITPAWSIFTANGSPTVSENCANWDAEWVMGTVDSALIAADGNQARFCIMYTVNPDEAEANTDVMFWLSVVQVPCGSVVSGTVTGAALEECTIGEVSDSMYFPFVLTQTTGWNTGIVITNLGTAVAPADMTVTMTLTDSTGAVFTYTKSDFTVSVWNAFLDNILANFSGTPAPGAAWLMISGNFPMDGYEFLTDGNFGAGTLPRLGGM